MLNSVIRILDPIFLPLLDSVGPLWTVIVVALCVSLLSSFAYKFFTDQHVMKELKSELKKLQKRVKEYKNDAEKMMHLNSQMMQKNMEYMKHSFKPMLITMVPILLLYWWLSMHIAYDPILPGEAFTVTVLMDKDAAGSVGISVPRGMNAVSESVPIVDRRAVFELSGEAGFYNLNYTYGSEFANNAVVITDGREYENPRTELSGSFSRAEVGLESKKILHIGGLSLSWLWVYIIFSIICSLIVRKSLGLH